MTTAKHRIAVIRFPGMNCEEETRRAVIASRMDCDVFMWNGPRSRLDEYDGYVLPGGFSYQDRVRAGAIAAKDRVVDSLFEAAARGKPIIGICNGAQILLEAGLVPGIQPGRIEMGLARNIMPDRDGYYTNWTHLRVMNDTSAATRAASEGTVLPIPVAHAEGRFVSSQEGLIDELFDRGQVVLAYARSDGSPEAGFPSNPNASTRSIAGVTNPAGNVVAMMPHPERAAWLFQVPEALPGQWGRRRRDVRRGDRADGPGPGAVVMDSLREFLSASSREV